jgi:hypothetical protein
VLTQAILTVLVGLPSLQIAHLYALQIGGTIRVQVLRLLLCEENGSARLEFVRSIENEGALMAPDGVVLLHPRDAETLLVVESNNHRVSHFALDGTLLRIFAGTCCDGPSAAWWSSADGALNYPVGIAVLGSSGEVAIADSNNHRVQIYDNRGKYNSVLKASTKTANSHFRQPLRRTHTATFLC